MKSHIRIISIFLFVLTATSTIMAARTFLHPGILNSKEELDFVKAKITANEQPWKGAYDMIRGDVGNLSYATHAVTVLGTDPAAETNANNFRDDSEYALKCALIWYYTGDVAYANKAIELLNSWSVFDDRSTFSRDLNLHWAAIDFVGAAEILNSFNSSWKPADVVKCKTMIRNLVTYHMKDNWYNNARQTLIRSRMGCAVFLEDEAMFDEQIRQWRWHISEYYYTLSDGPNPTRFVYTTNTLIDGMCWELCRDFNHGNMGSKGTFEGAEIAWHQGVDLYKEEQTRMSKFLELISGYYMNLVQIPSDICGANNPWNHAAGTLWCNEDGRLWPSCTNNTQVIRENAYNHYKYRLGVDLPNTLAYNNARRTNGYMKMMVLVDYVQPFAANPNDTDNDGILNISDNCPFTSNANQADLDGDSKGDACDDDIDGDGVLNTADNCPMTANVDQADEDADKIGDVCDANKGDKDNDGVKDAIDNCPNTANPLQEDSDKDGVGDVCETSSTKYPGKIWKIPGTIDARFFDLGGEGKAYHDSNPGLEKSTLVSPRTAAGPEDVELEPTNIAYIKHDEWLKYTVDSVKRGIYTIKVNSAALSYAANYEISLNDVIIASITANPTSGWQTYQEFSVTNIKIDAEYTNAVIKVRFVNTSLTTVSLCNFKDFTFVKTADVPATDITEIAATKRFTISPNPARNAFNIITKNLTIKNMTIRNAIGMTVYEQTVSDSNNIVVHTNFAKGIYFVSITDSRNKVYSEKLIIQ
jgi:hypothetical protein